MPLTQKNIRLAEESGLSTAFTETSSNTHSTLEDILSTINWRLSVHGIVHVH